MLREWFGFGQEADPIHLKLVQNQINMTNAKRGFYIMILGVIFEAALIIFYDIPNVLQNGWFTGLAVWYVVIHSVLLMTSALGLFLSWRVMHGGPVLFAQWIPLEYVILIFATIFVSGIAWINGMDQRFSDNTALYMTYTLFIGALLLIKPQHGVFGAGFAHLVFLLGQFKYQTNPDILIANIINASLVVICAAILSYFFYHNYATLTLKSLELQESTEKLRILSITDPLTGLYNRRHFYSQAEQVKLKQQMCGIILFDLDAFKSINDTYGHVVGDEMLVLFSSLLQAKTKADDFAVRWGGEEFLLLLMRDSAEEIEKDVHEILLACEETYSTTLSRPVKLTASAGVLLCHSYNYNHIDDYVSDADEALYQSKEAGGNRSTIVEKK